MKKRTLIIIFLLICFFGLILFRLVSFFPFWDPSYYSSELRLDCYLMRFAQGLCVLLAGGIVWTLVKAFRRKTIRLGAIVLAGIAVLAGFLIMRIAAIYPAVQYLQKEVKDCQDYNMGTIYLGVLRYWEDHDGKNPKGTGLGGKVTPEDWERELDHYADVWSGLRNENGIPIHLFKCPDDHSSRHWSYEINPDLTSSNYRTVWIAREQWGPGATYHHGYRGVLYASTNWQEYGLYNVISVRPSP